MNTQNNRYSVVVKAIVVAAGFLIVTTPGYTTENAQERRAARDTKQDSRQDARSEKAECRSENDKSNAECRQDKREAKQTGREESRDVRSGAAPKN